MSFKLFISLLFFLSSFQAVAQHIFPSGDVMFTNRRLQDLAKKYIGHNVFNMTFTNLVDSVLKEPGIWVDTTINHTDTSKFYLRAYHASFNPFGMSFDSIRTIFAEIVHRERSTKEVIDTVFYLQTQGIAVGKDRLGSLQETFKKMGKEIRNGFNQPVYRKTKNKKEVTGEILTYYFPQYPMPLLSIAWHKRSENVTTLIITFMVRLVKTSSE